jgi:prevent-host-death family protein
VVFLQLDFTGKNDYNYGQEDLQLRSKRSEKFYSIAQAKAKLSEVVKESQKDDVLITKNGVPYAALIGYERYRKISKLMDDLYDLYLLEVGDPSKFAEISSDKMLDEDFEEV